VRLLFVGPWFCFPYCSCSLADLGLRSAFCPYGLVCSLEIAMAMGVNGSRSCKRATKEAICQPAGKTGDWILHFEFWTWNLDLGVGRWPWFLASPQSSRLGAAYLSSAETRDLSCGGGYRYRCRVPRPRLH